MRGMSRATYANLCIETKNHKTAMLDYIRYYTHKLKVGIPIAITGSSHLKSGVGKSYTAMRIAELMDKDFREGTAGMEKIVFEPEEYVEAMENLEKRRGVYGQTIIVDEAGILVNAKKWYSYFNQAMTDTVVTFRELRGLALFVTPALKSIDRDIRIYTTHTGTCYKHYASGKQIVLMKWHRNYWDEWTGKPWKKRVYMFFQEQQRLVRIDRFKVRHPKNKELIEEYEKRMRKYKSAIRQKITLYSFKEKTTAQLIQDIIQEGDAVSIHSKTGQPYVYAQDVQDLYGVTYRKSVMLARKVNEKLRKDGRTNTISN